MFASSGSAQVIEDVALVAEAAAKKHEDNKCSLVDSGCASQLVEGLRTEEVSQSSSAVQAVCACLKSLTTADDPKPAASRYNCHVWPCSQCFAHVSGCNPSLHNLLVLVSLLVYLFHCSERLFSKCSMFKAKTSLANMGHRHR